MRAALVACSSNVNGLPSGKSSSCNIGCVDAGVVDEAVAEDTVVGPVLPVVVVAVCAANDVVVVVDDAAEGCGCC